MFFHFRDQFPELSPLLDKYQSFQKRLEVSAKTVLLEEGKISQNYIFIESGCIRAYFNNNGDEVTFQFFFENEGLSSIDSFINNVPSSFTIETIEPSVVYLMPKPHVMQMYDELSHEPRLVRMMLQMSSRRQVHYINEFVSMVRDSPEQRYQRLLDEKPHIIQRIPQHYIASYLGVSKVHLSRIKAKLARGNAHF